jgi:hypothetical protein
MPYLVLEGGFVLNRARKIPSHGLHQATVMAGTEQLQKTNYLDLTS